MNKKLISISIICILFAVSFINLNTVAKNSNNLKITTETIEVHPGQSIQKAINSANTGDTIKVFNGVYKECVIIDRTINLIGENNENTIIDGSDFEDIDNLIEIGENVDDILIEGFTIRYGGYGIYINSLNNDITISNNIIKDNRFDGIYAILCNNNEISGNTIIKNDWNGIFLYCSNSNKIINGNSIKENEEKGVSLVESYNNRIVGNTIKNNQDGQIYESERCKGQNEISDNGFLFVNHPIIKTLFTKIFNFLPIQNLPFLRKY